MENLRSYVQEQIAYDTDVTGILAVRTSSPFSPLVDGFDILLLVITKETTRMNYTNHYSKDGLSIQERRISQAALQQWIVTGENRSIIEWIIQGEIVLDRDVFLQSTRERLVDFPIELREQKLFIEFAHFLRRYLQSKQFLKDGHVFDAYTNIVEALQHWARIALVEQGYHPELTLWQQVRHINPGVYKLHEELTMNHETLEQRVQLVLLACEFNVMSKMEACCQILIRVLKSREEAFAPYELKYHDELRPLHVDMALVLKKLVNRGLIREVLYLKEPGIGIDAVEVRYTCV